MEAKINSLYEQVAVLTRQQEEQRKHWFQCSLFAWGVAVLFAILTILGGIFGIVSGATSAVAQIFGVTMLFALFLGLAFSRAAAALTGQPIRGNGGTGAGVA